MIFKDGFFHSFKPALTELRFCFVDGGSAALFSGPERSAYFIRATAVVMEGTSRAREKSEGFYVIVRVKDDSGRLVIQPEIIGSRLLNPDDLRVDVRNRELSEGNHLVKHARIADMARRFSELALAAELTETLKPGSILVLDGSLARTLPNEEAYISGLLEHSARQDVLVCSLAKSSVMLTSEGLSLADQLKRCAPEGCWYYHLRRERAPDVFFVRLHPESGYVFRFEVSHDQCVDLEKLFSALAFHSRDIAFPGYPYGLVAADLAARLGERETGLLVAELGLTTGICQDVHTRLNSIAYR